MPGISIFNFKAITCRDVNLRCIYIKKIIEVSEKFLSVSNLMRECIALREADFVLGFEEIKQMVKDYLGLVINGRGMVLTARARASFGYEYCCTQALGVCQS
jgi:hypothetical protein